MRHVYALLCTERCSLTVPCLPLFQVCLMVAGWLISFACWGFEMDEGSLEDDLGRVALMSSLLKKFCKSSFANDL